MSRSDLWCAVIGFSVATLLCMALGVPITGQSAADRIFAAFTVGLSVEAIRWGERVRITVTTKGVPRGE